MLKYFNFQLFKSVLKYIAFFFYYTMNGFFAWVLFNFFIFYSPYIMSIKPHAVSFLIYMAFMFFPAGYLKLVIDKPLWNLFGKFTKFIIFVIIVIVSSILYIKVGLFNLSF